MSARVPSLNVPVTKIWLVWPTDASVTFAPLIVADTRVAVEDGAAGGAGGVEPLHEIHISGNRVVATNKRGLLDIASPNNMSTSD
jgi:hypothetical protein